MSLESGDSGFSIDGVDLEADPLAAELLGRDEARPGAQKRIEDRRVGDAMELDAAFGQLHREARRMVKLLRARLHRLVGNEPRVAGAAPVGAVLPAGNVGLVLVGHADGEAVHLPIAGPGEMEYRLLFVVRSEWRRVGKEVGSTCRSRLLPEH